ncbi:hypothetical protein DPMN_040028 [Dreissena polymorpha]|uniref:Uncharacterized protein n=1 Tax=Dreissena polymorpha TaxID=45954 RepID=A0A9D4HUL4_DREPO|nr:hypothetical protein DPMN_040028 [Dreissena polymorpha]
MTRLGYGKEIRRWRVEKYRESDKLLNATPSHVTRITTGSKGEGLNATPSNVTRITTGSKGEGLTYYFESDFDFLFSFNYVLCVEAGIDIHHIQGDIEEYRMDTRVHAGHCRLLQERE